MPYFVDESRIEAAQDATIAARRDLRDHVAVIEAVLRFIDDLILAHRERNAGELVVLRLALRCFNSTAGAFRLLRGGYYQPAFAATRDLLETLFLLDLFGRDNAALARWQALPERDREREFRPARVRERLDALDGNAEGRRAAAYRRLSAYATHPTPEGFAIISPNWITQRGPFPDERLLAAGIEELALRAANAGECIAANIIGGTADVERVKATFAGSVRAWLANHAR
jgi:hypothetical protein